MSESLLDTIFANILFFALFFFLVRWFTKPKAHISTPVKTNIPLSTQSPVRVKSYMVLEPVTPPPTTTPVRIRPLSDSKESHHDYSPKIEIEEHKQDETDGQEEREASDEDLTFSENKDFISPFSPAVVSPLVLSKKAYLRNAIEKAE